MREEELGVMAVNVGASYGAVNWLIALRLVTLETFPPTLPLLLRRLWRPDGLQRDC